MMTFCRQPAPTNNRVLISIGANAPLVNILIFSRNPKLMSEFRRSNFAHIEKNFYFFKYTVQWCQGSWGAQLLTFFDRGDLLCWPSVSLEGSKSPHHFVIHKILNSWIKLPITVLRHWSDLFMFFLIWDDSDRGRIVPINFRPIQ